MFSNVKVIPTFSSGLSGKIDHHDHVVPEGKIKWGLRHQGALLGQVYQDHVTILQYILEVRECLSGYEFYRTPSQSFQASSGPWSVKAFVCV